MTNENPKRFIVAVYMVDLAFGGHEEGGWYYQCGERIRQMRMFRNEDSAYDYARKLNERLESTLNKGRREISSVLSDGRYAAQVHADSAPEYFPAQRPHYE